MDQRTQPTASTDLTLPADSYQESEDPHIKFSKAQERMMIIASWLRRADNTLITFVKDPSLFFDHVRRLTTLRNTLGSTVLHLEHVAGMDYGDFTVFKRPKGQPLSRVFARKSNFAKDTMASESFEAKRTSAIVCGVRVRDCLERFKSSLESFQGDLLLEKDHRSIIEALTRHTEDTLIAFKSSTAVAKKKYRKRYEQSVGLHKTQNSRRSSCTECVRAGGEVTCEYAEPEDEEQEACFRCQRKGMTCEFSTGGHEAADWRVFPEEDGYYDHDQHRGERVRAATHIWHQKERLPIVEAKSRRSTSLAVDHAQSLNTLPHNPPKPTQLNRPSSPYAQMTTANTVYAYTSARGELNQETSLVKPCSQPCLERVPRQAELKTSPSILPDITRQTFLPPPGRYGDSSGSTRPAHPTSQSFYDASSMYHSSWCPSSPVATTTSFQYSQPQLLQLDPDPDQYLVPISYPERIYPSRTSQGQWLS